MKLAVKISCTIAVVIGAALTYAWPWVKMEFAGSAHYTEQDKREYEFYTPDLLKEIPRISSHYEFDYANITGPEAQAFAVSFYGTNDISKVHVYLISRGYKKQTACNLEAECWRTPGSREVITVVKLHSPDIVKVQIYSSPYTQ
jgi:hypothetical protein